MKNIIKNIVYSTLGVLSSNMERSQKLIEEFQKSQKEQRAEGKKIVNDFLSNPSKQELIALDSFFAKYQITDAKYLLPSI